MHFFDDKLAQVSVANLEGGRLAPLHPLGDGLTPLTVMLANAKF